MNHQKGGLLTDDFIRSLLEKTDIVQLVHQSVPLKKAGANYVACCPFHNEKSPSFTVTPNKQFFHCFGCGVSGDAISFLRSFYNLNFMEAVERLAAHLGVPVPQTQHHNQENRDALKPYFALLERVASYYQHALKHHPENQIPIQYLKKRGLEGLTAKMFRIGYAPSHWDNLVQHFGEEKENIALLEKLGLIIRHEKGHYFDRFRHRIMFPIRNRKGEVIGFGGRIIDEKDAPKYMNSPESIVFKKGNHLYGQYEAHLQHNQWKTAICVEGYLDVIGLYQQGVIGAFATMGTALSEQHIKRLFQLSDEIVFCFDGDKAGRNAAWKALEVLLPHYNEQKRVKFLFLPEGEDPDSYIRIHGKEEFIAQLKKSLSLSEYFFSSLCDKYPPNNVENRAQLIRVGRQYIDQLPKSTYQRMMTEALAQLTSTSQQIVTQKYNFLSKGQQSFKSQQPYGAYRGNAGEFRPYNKNNKNYQNPNKDMGPTTAPPPLLGPSYIASGLLLTEPTLIEVVGKQSLWEDINIPGLSLLKAVCDLLLTVPVAAPDALMASLLERGFTRNLLQQCFNKVKFIPPEGRKDELLGALDRILVIGRTQIIENLLKKSESEELNSEEKAILKKFLTFRESSDENEI